MAAAAPVVGPRNEAAARRDHLVEPADGRVQVRDALRVRDGAVVRPLVERLPQVVAGVHGVRARSVVREHLPELDLGVVEIGARGHVVGRAGSGPNGVHELERLLVPAPSDVVLRVGGVGAACIGGERRLELRARVRVGVERGRALGEVEPRAAVEVGGLVEHPGAGIGRLHRIEPSHGVLEARGRGARGAGEGRELVRADPDLVAAPAPVVRGGVAADRGGARAAENRVVPELVEEPARRGELGLRRLEVALRRRGVARLAVGDPGALGGHAGVEVRERLGVERVARPVRVDGHEGVAWGSAAASLRPAREARSERHGEDGEGAETCRRCDHASSTSSGIPGPRGDGAAARAQRLHARIRRGLAPELPRRFLAPGAVPLERRDLREGGARAHVAGLEIEELLEPLPRLAQPALAQLQGGELAQRIGVARIDGERVAERLAGLGAAALRLEGEREVVPGRDVAGRLGEQGAVRRDGLVEAARLRVGQPERELRRVVPRLRLERLLQLPDRVVQESVGGVQLAEREPGGGMTRIDLQRLAVGGLGGGGAPLGLVELPEAGPGDVVVGPEGDRLLQRGPRLHRIPGGLLERAEVHVRLRVIASGDRNGIEVSLPRLRAPPLLVGDEGRKEPVLGHARSVGEEAVCLVPCALEVARLQRQVEEAPPCVVVAGVEAEGLIVGLERERRIARALPRMAEGAVHAGNVRRELGGALDDLQRARDVVLLLGAEPGTRDGEAHLRPRRRELDRALERPFRVRPPARLEVRGAERHERPRPLLVRARARRRLEERDRLLVRALPPEEVAEGDAGGAVRGAERESATQVLLRAGAVAELLPGPAEPERGARGRPELVRALEVGEAFLRLARDHQPVTELALERGGPRVLRERLPVELDRLLELGAARRAELRRVNVDGTRNVVELASAARRLRRLNHFSTAYVSGDRVGVILEDELAMGQRFHNPYEETKFQGELLVRRAQADLPATIYRPSIVVGDSRTGEIDRFEGPYALAILLVASPLAVPLPLPGDAVAPLNVVPVDFVVDAVLRIAENPAAAGRTVHLVDPAPLSARRVYEMIAARAGKKLPPVSVPARVLQALLQLPLLERLSRAHRPAIEYVNHLAIYNCRNLLELLDGSGIHCPPSTSYLDRLIEFVQATSARRREQELEAEADDPLDPRPPAAGGAP